MDRKIWTAFPTTLNALLQTYEAQGMSAPDEGYYLAALQTFTMTWRAVHTGKEVPVWILDQAAANEVFYQATRGRQFRRNCAALAACWKNLVTDRPERILTRFDRWQKRESAKKQ
jgi:hypothetical protein